MENRSPKYIQRSNHYTNGDIRTNTLLFSITGGIMLMIFAVVTYYIGLHNIWEEYVNDLLILIISTIFFIGGFLSFFIAMNELRENWEFLMVNFDKLPYWRQDYHWPRKALKSGNLADLGKYFGVFMLYLIVTIFFGYWGFYLGKGILSQFIFLLFLVAMIFAIIDLIKRVNHHLQFGNSLLIPKNLPIYIGEELKAIFINRAVCRNFKNLNVSLKLIQEEEVLIEGKEAVERVIKFMRLYQYQDSFETMGDQCNIQVLIPYDLPSTHLNSKTPLYWVLDIKAQNQKSVDRYECTFLLPIYEKLEE